MNKKVIVLAILILICLTVFISGCEQNNGKDGLYVQNVTNDTNINNSISSGGSGGGGGSGPHKINETK